MIKLLSMIRNIRLTNCEPITYMTVIFFKPRQFLCAFKRINRCNFFYCDKLRFIPVKMANWNNSYNSTNQPRSYEQPTQFQSVSEIEAQVYQNNGYHRPHQLQPTAREFHPRNHIPSGEVPVDTEPKPKKQYKPKNRFQRSRHSDHDNRPSSSKPRDYQRSNEGTSEPSHPPPPRNSYNSNRKSYKSYPTSRNPSSGGLYRNLDPKPKPVENSESLREKLTRLANEGAIECMICFGRVRRDNSIWSCNTCYLILHINCAQKWADSCSDSRKNWRCPACQNVSEEYPEKYYCYCKKEVNVYWDHRSGGLPHSCGNSCGRVSKKSECVHKCTLSCHPGPCPDCTVYVSRECGCGATSQTVQCSNPTKITCTNICNKKLNCGIHFCDKKCHAGDCDKCDQQITQVCHCGTKTQQIDCNISADEVFSCGEICGKLLNCGNHTCKKVCHDGDCEECELAPEFVTTCHCGQTALTETRKSCLDPIPCCDKICSKNLKCGQPCNHHTCKVKCHEGDCPKCDLSTLVRCRCGHMDREIPCTQLTGRPDDARCEKKCSKKRSCGRHKCNKLCCIDLDHECLLICNRMLSCGLHRCENTCHRGRCLPCLQSSFEELYCECRTNFIPPPVACGTRPPECRKPCSRQHECNHEILHNCHSEPQCPPCTVLTTKTCFGNHEMRKTIPCHQASFSCGRPCGKDLSCGRHKCISICHEGPCSQICQQPCTTLRPACGHICGVPCHSGTCPDSTCKEMVKVQCECGNRSLMRNCSDQTREYQRLMTSILASKMKDVQLGNSVDISKREIRLKVLDCNDECRVLERNRKLAIGLQIRNPDITQKLAPRYSDSMKVWAKKDPRFCQRVHDKLTELVQLAKQSKQKSRSYSFESMNRDKRHFVHEYCEHFGCESAAYDQEPNRNIVATANKDKAWLPSHSLLEMIQRESGQRKVPGPAVLRGGIQRSVPPSSSTTLRLGGSGGSMLQSSSLGESSNNVIDYFDCLPEKLNRF